MAPPVTRTSLEHLSTWTLESAWKYTRALFELIHRWSLAVRRVFCRVVRAARSPRIRGHLSARTARHGPRAVCPATTPPRSPHDPYAARLPLLCIPGSTLPLSAPDSPGVPPRDTSTSSSCRCRCRCRRRHPTSRRPAPTTAGCPQHAPLLAATLATHPSRATAASRRWAMS